MSDAELVFVTDLTVALDYGQFYLHTGDEEPDLMLDLIDRAHDADGIAQQGGMTLVLSPHQNNFEMPLRVEVWSTAPANDLDLWEEAFEVHLDVGESRFMYDSPTCEFIDIPAPYGSYHAMITGRGFVGHGWPGSTTPGDMWRIRMWPSSGPERPRRLREYVGSD